MTSQERASITELDRPFRAVVFDWDGTAVVDRQEDGAPLAASIRPLLRQGVWIVVVTGTNVGHIDRQLFRLIPAADRARLLAGTNRGSEVYGFDRRGRMVRRWLRTASPAEDRRLSEIAEAVRAEIVNRTGLEIEIVSNRLNRRKVDLIPVPEWADPPKARIGELLAAVESRLRDAGWSGGLAAAVQLAADVAREHGLPDARITSDVKNIEIGLTDKGDAVDWIKRELLAPNGIALGDVLIAGDEFGPIAGVPGSDDRLREQATPDATVVSVGVEPNGVPPGVLHLGGGPPRFRALLDQQILLHERASDATSAGKAPLAARTATPRSLSLDDWLASALAPPADPRWLLREEGYRPPLEHEMESRFAVANGLLGVRASLVHPTPASLPRTYIAGLFTAPGHSYAVPALAVAPDWLRLELSVDGVPLTVERGTIAQARTLDLQRGVLLGSWRHQEDGQVTTVSTLRFASHADRPVAVLLARLERPPGPRLMLDAWLEPATSATLVEGTEPDVTVWRLDGTGQSYALASAATLWQNGRRLPEQSHSALRSTWVWRGGEESTILTRIVAIARNTDGGEPDVIAQEGLDRSRRQGVRRLLAAHARAWEARWRASDVVVEGDEEAQRELRFALYHLNSAVNPDDGRVSIGARSLTGDGYLGHVFWDTEIFLLPFYILTWPDAARALLMYRYHTLPGARAKAEGLGYRGAFYAWESTDDGSETTPSVVIGPEGDLIPILSGSLELHISADIAYAVWQYWQVTGDDAFLRDAGAEIILETARFWASRVELEADGRYHMRRVIGPDEYHEAIDDNAFTNVMAQWNLERGAEVAALLAKRWPERWTALAARLQLMPGETEQWREIADRIYSGFDPETGLFEQFAGFFQLEPIDLAAYEPRTAPMDVLLGRERTQRSQVIKQADVVMLLALLWDRFPDAVRRANFAYYEPRTGHGSSLSPPVHAVVAARLGDTALAERYFDQTAVIDLDDTMGNAAHGVHIATMGGLWQAAVFGFAGLTLRPDGLRFDPRLPARWEALRFPVRWRGRELRIAIENNPPSFTATVEHGRPLRLALGDASHRLGPGETWTTTVDTDAS